MIRYTSMARAAINPSQAYELGMRALALGCDAGVLWNSRRRWIASASKDGYRTPRVGGFATVYDALEAALDAMEAYLDTEQRDRLADRYSGDELLGIYNATGGEVARA